MLLATMSKNCLNCIHACQPSQPNSQIQHSAAPLNPYVCCIMNSGNKLVDEAVSVEA